MIVDSRLYQRKLLSVKMKDGLPYFVNKPTSGKVLFGPLVFKLLDKFPQFQSEHLSSQAIPELHINKSKLPVYG